MADPYANMGNSIAEGILNVLPIMDKYHKEHVGYDQQMQLADALSRLGINEQGQITTLDSETKGGPKIQPIIDPKALDTFRTKSHEGQVKAAGALEAINRMAVHGLGPVIGQMGQEQLKAQRLQNQRINVQAGGNVYPVSPTTALNAVVEEPERAARTEHIKEQTAASKEDRAAAASQASVMMDIGGGNFARVPVNELIKHPEFLRDQSAKDLNNQVFAATGLGIPQIAQGWNKRVSNGQLTFDAPVVQQTIDPISQRPIPKYNADGTPAYEQMPNPAFKGGKTESPTITKTMRYQVPQEFTPEVLRLTGTHDVQGAEQIKIPPQQDRSTKIVPKSAGVGTGPQVGDKRMINGVLAQWDGHGWVAAGQ